MGPSLDRMSALGASVLPGAVAFRVWAPRCQSVDVVVDGRAVEALAPREGGLFEARLEGVAEGARYKYRLDATRYRPDPVSRFQPEGIHGPSVAIDPNRFVWTDQEFAGHAPGLDDEQRTRIGPSQRWLFATIEKIRRKLDA